MLFDLTPIEPILADISQNDNFELPASGGRYTLLFAVFKAALGHLSKKTAENRASQVRKELAKELRGLVAGQDTPADVMPDANATRLPSPNGINPSISHGAYVHRETEETEFKRLFDAGTKVIIFVGQAGMGKTWLARRLTRGLDDSTAPRIRFYSGQPDINDVQRALTKCSVDKVVVDNPATCLVELCEGDKAPPVIVLDNFNSSDELYAIFPDPPRSTIVATSRSKGAMKPGSYQFIEVDRMTLQESTKLVALHSPNLREDDAARLSDAVACYPLVIPTMCALMRLGNLSVEETLRELAIDRGQVFSGIPTEDQSTLLAVLRRLTDLIDARSTMAGQILRLVSYTHRYGQQVGAEPMIRGCVQFGLDAGYTKLRYIEALQILNDCFVLDISKRHMTDEEKQRLRSNYESFPVSDGYILTLNAHTVIQDILLLIWPDLEVEFLIALERTHISINRALRGNQFVSSLDYYELGMATWSILFTYSCLLGRVVLYREPRPVAIKLEGGYLRTHEEWKSCLGIMMAHLLSVAEPPYPEIVSRIIDKAVPGLIEWFLAYGSKSQPQTP